MIAKHGGACTRCFVHIEAGADIHFKRGVGIRHPVCPPISTADLVAGRERYQAEQVRKARRQPDADENPYARHDAANEAWTVARAGEGAAG